MYLKTMVKANVLIKTGDLRFQASLSYTEHFRSTFTIDRLDINSASDEQTNKNNYSND